MSDWVSHPCARCRVPINIPRGHPDGTVRLCLGCQSWVRVEVVRVKQGLAPSIENNLGQDQARDQAASTVLALLDAPLAPEQRYPETPKPTHEPDDYGYGGYFG